VVYHHGGGTYMMYGIGIPPQVKKKKQQHGSCTHHTAARTSNIYIFFLSEAQSSLEKSENQRMLTVLW
jgi:hypothetical protein